MRRGDFMLIEYLPVFLRDIKEFNVLFNTEDAEFDLIKKCMKDIENNMFILTSDENGICRYENILGINNKSGSIDYRKKRLIIRFNEKLPYSAVRLKESLDAICKNLFFCNYNEYTLILRLDPLSDEMFDEVKLLLDRMVPANILIKIFSFNTHEILGKLRHIDLEPFRHKELYEKILGRA